MRRRPTPSVPLPPEAVQVREGTVELPTYEPAPPDRNPMFLDRRVYQGSSGRVYPLPVIDRIAERPVPRTWRAVFLENEYVEVLVLPEIGGRIHAFRDKTNGYDTLYRQAVIKPALVGLAGPWLSGGIELNWPQHHRPATFMPVDVEVERAEDGSVTVWCGDHDPLQRLRGLHGVCLRPGSSVLELRVSVQNRTPLPHTFLWWANVATRVHEAYQSFFPPEVTVVADHARRSMSRFPHCAGRYYGVDYAGRARSGVPASEAPSRFRPPHVSGKSPDQVAEGLPAYRPDDLSFYANIPVPTSYMVLGSRGGFFGGYDYRERAGLVHVADPGVSPGKKQWTWGNHEFGYAWDRHLTDPGPDGVCAPYIELMAGVFTDNQPDFSFLQPGEARTWVQRWYPLRAIGPAHAASEFGALHAAPEGKGFRLGVAVNRSFPGAQVVLVEARGRRTAWTVDLAPDRPWVHLLRRRPAVERVEVTAADGTPVVTFAPGPVDAGQPVPPPAEEPPAPESVESVDELYLTGVHLEQYRHATRSPVPYWREGLRRDPGDARCHTALGRWHLRRGEFVRAEEHLREAVARLTRRNANPPDGEALYLLGVVLTHREKREEAFHWFSKAAWNEAWQPASWFAAAELEARAGRWISALDHLDRCLRRNTDHLGARVLRSLVLERLGRREEAQAELTEVLRRDPLDAAARHLTGRTAELDLQTRLDVAHDLARAGFRREALDVLRAPAPRAGDPRDRGATPLVAYLAAALLDDLGEAPAARRAFRDAARRTVDHCFPARLEEMTLLERVIRRFPRDPHAPYLLGNLLYDRQRRDEAIQLWRRSARLDPRFPTVWRNLGMAAWNVQRDPGLARRCYDRALRLDPRDARIVYERDQLWKRIGVEPERRWRELRRHARAVGLRDDLTLEWCALLNDRGTPDQAWAVLLGRRFQPWEGGEGRALGEYGRTSLALGLDALAAGKPRAAIEVIARALHPPESLGEARHLLANPSDIRFLLGVACAAAGAPEAAREHWRSAANWVGDFQDMSVRGYSEMTVYSALAWRGLGERDRADALLRDLLAHACALEHTDARVDYFATSLPTMLLFEDDLQERQRIRARFLQAQALFALGRRSAGRCRLRDVLQRDPNHSGALDFQRRLPFLR